MLYCGTRWVMRVSRLKRCRDDAGSDELVEAFASWQLTASPSRLSRWEYGNSRGSYRLLRAYEAGCGMPPFLLFALNDRQARAADSSFADVSSVDATEFLLADDIYEIFDRALTDADVSGSQWYQLASFAASHRYFYLSPRNTGIVARRLIEELARSLGPAYILRFEALHLLASQSRMNKALVEQLTEMFQDESTGALGDAVSLILRAAPPIRAELLSRMRESESPMMRNSRDWVAEIHRKSPTEKAVDRARVSALTATLCEGLPKWAMAHVETDMTAPLINEALGERSRLKRHEASLLLMLAKVYETLSVQLLDAFESEVNPVLRRRLANLLEYQVPASCPDRLESLALAEEDPEARRSLWASRGHVLDPVHVSDSIVADLADPGSQYAVSYALGISGSIDDKLLDCQDLPDHLRSTLGWWRQRGAGILS